MDKVEVELADLTLPCKGVDPLRQHLAGLDLVAELVQLRLGHLLLLGALEWLLRNDGQALTNFDFILVRVEIHRPFLAAELAELLDDGVRLPHLLVDLPVLGLVTLAAGLHVDELAILVLECALVIFEFLHSIN